MYSVDCSPLEVFSFENYNYPFNLLKNYSISTTFSVSGAAVAAIAAVAAVAANAAIAAAVVAAAVAAVAGYPLPAPSTS